MVPGVFLSMVDDESPARVPRRPGPKAGRNESIDFFRGLIYMLISYATLGTLLFALWLLWKHVGLRP